MTNPETDRSSFGWPIVLASSGGVTALTVWAWKISSACAVLILVSGVLVAFYVAVPWSHKLWDESKAADRASFVQLKNQVATLHVALLFMLLLSSAAGVALAAAYDALPSFLTNVLHRSSHDPVLVKQLASEGLVITVTSSDSLAKTPYLAMIDEQKVAGYRAVPFVAATLDEVLEPGRQLHWILCACIALLLAAASIVEWLVPRTQLGVNIGRGPE